MLTVQPLPRPTRCDQKGIQSLHIAALLFGIVSQLGVEEAVKVHPSRRNVFERLQYTDHV